MSTSSDLSSSEFEGEESDDASSNSSEESDFIQVKKKQKITASAKLKASVEKSSSKASGGASSSRSKGVSPPGKVQSKVPPQKIASVDNKVKGNTVSSVSAASAARTPAPAIARSISVTKSEVSDVLAAPAAAPAYSGVDITQGPPVASESAARKLILQYMMQQNRYAKKVCF
jgi:hypothetical protein